MKDFEIRCDESRLETNHALYGKFTLGPFLPGQGTTFGNALRRSLLSELSGLAITAFEILGVMQEFSILPGLRESILDLSLNLKQVVLTGILPYSTPPIGFLKVRGPAVIKAADLKLPAGLYCTSPDQYIATLSSDGILNLKIVISVGKGYSTQPYSFYRSLSKIKLQSTFLNMSRQDEEQSEFVANKAEVMNGLRTPSKAKSTESLFHEASAYPTELRSSLGKKSEAQGQMVKQTFQATPSASYLTEGLPVEDKGNDELAKKIVEEDTKTASDLANRITSPPFSTNATPVTPEVGCVSSEVQVPQVVKGNLEKAESSQKRLVEGQASLPSTSSTSFSGIDKKTSNKFIPTLRNQSSDLFNTSVISLNAANGISGVSDEMGQYSDIQSQIFQRIKPHQVLPIDAVFTPVSRVNFLIEINDRFEIPRENIVLEIWTNGSIHPKRALEEATLSLVQSFDTLLKKVQQSSSIYKGLRYWAFLQSSDYRTNETAGTQHPSFDNVEKTEDKVVQNGGTIKTPIEDTNSSYSFKKGFKTPTSQVNHTHLGRDSKSEAHAVGAENELTSFVSPQIVTSSSKRQLHRAIYNLDIGNLNLSLETFVLLKEANISTLAQLLTCFSLEKNTLTVNSKGRENSFFLNKKVLNELKSVVTQFS